ncbi:hypothetical protein [Anaerotignum sp. MB30-C6]|uniref:hypothetical protein n=1 Tax=Anaerotignum sp. MB30-C6 TaxID=3070814 RepID=UPI0027DB5C91|nr:hypothetical protein [Anaerotignum sp. MB30-C6]WMI81545.1 hypothetical protein RBQ60_02080 [Anaerotignum sp. MB30-C6]
MTRRIFITGDKHGTFVPLFALAEKVELRDTDILIVAGDAGYVWNDDYHYNVQSLQQIFPGIITFIDGNHENHVLLNSFEVSQWNGGNVHRIGERVYHLMRGQVYSIYGNNILTFGGARSVDKDRREEGVSWWKEEEPTAEEIEYGKKQLIQHADVIDYVITHESPLFARSHITRPKRIDVDYHLPEFLDEWYEIISSAPRLKKWYFGHMHVDQLITPQLRAVHNDILLIGEEKPIRWG